MRIKGFDQYLCCRGMQYEVGKEYDTHFSDLKVTDLCSNKVIHYGDSLRGVNDYYTCHNKRNRFCFIEVLGEEITNGHIYGSNHIRIVREITGYELENMKGLTHKNVGLFNSGHKNTGDGNNGSDNVGNDNVGDENAGDGNVGSLNIGDGNCGSGNSGFFNKGNYNSGDANAGNYNAGDVNLGDRNTGKANEGDRNSGSYNAGNRNSGYCNMGNGNIGVFCTFGSDKYVPFFNKESTMSIFDWEHHPVFRIMEKFIMSRWICFYEMNDDEKKNHPYAKRMGEYLKVYSYQEAWRNLWDGLDYKERMSFKSLPNFDAEIFERITGISDFISKEE